MGCGEITFKVGKGRVLSGLSGLGCLGKVTHLPHL